MKVKVLGCVSPVATKTDNLSGYLVSVDSDKILLDAGSGITKEMDLPTDLTNLKIVITHLHPDHYVEIFNIINAVKEYKRKQIPLTPIELYIPSKPSNIYRLIKKENNSTLVLKKYNENTKIKTNSYLLSFCKTIHGDMESYAVKIFNNYTTFVYTGDVSNLCLQKLVNFSQKANTILCDSSLLRVEGVTNDKYHMTAHEASNYARLSNTYKLILTHFNSFVRNDNKIQLEAANNFQNVLLAKTGEEYNL